MRELTYPFDVYYLLNNRANIISKLMTKEGLLPRRIAIFGTTNNTLIKELLEMFLLNYGIKPLFYESCNFYEDVIYEKPELLSFDPDIVYICTSQKSVTNFPDVNTTDVKEKFVSEYNKYEDVWKKLDSLFHPIIIQNNFDFPLYRLYGNKDAVDIHGRINFLTRLNQKFYGYINSHNNIYICDINYLSAVIGLDKWFNFEEWHLYNYFLDSKAMPLLAFNVANIIKSLYGKNKRAFALDLDNTIWGGKISLEGIKGIDTGSVSLAGHAYLDFQEYLKKLKEFGVILNINTKNNYDSTIAALKSKNNILNEDDFVIIKSNNNSKSSNIVEIADELGIDTDSIIFVDDNKLERNQVDDINISVPKLTEPFEYIRVIDRNGYFENTKYDKFEFNKMELESKVARSKFMSNYENRDDYLKALNMKAEICTISSDIYNDVFEFINNGHSFNFSNITLTMEDLNNQQDINIYAKLSDVIDDFGIVSVLSASIKGIGLYINSWYINSSAINVDLEYAIMEELIIKAKSNGLKKIFVKYTPSDNNKKVLSIIKKLDFKFLDADDNHDKSYMIDVGTYQFKNKYIEIVKHD